MRKHGAFSLVELMVVMVVIGILATMALPRLAKKKPSTEWKNVLEEVNNLVYYARQEAISTQNTYRLHFQSKKTAVDTVQVELEGPDPQKPTHKIYRTVRSHYFKPIYTFPEEITIHEVYHGKQKQFEENKNHAYCYVIPNGLVQEILVHLERTRNGEKSKVTFKMSPFFGKFELLEGFVKHE